MLQSLKTVDELNKKIIDFYGIDSIIKMTENNIIPHYVVTNPLDGSFKYAYVSSEVNEWFETSNVRKVDADLQRSICFYGGNINESSYDMLDCPIELSQCKNIKRIPLENVSIPSGIYFLCLDRKIVYIGQAKNISHRVSTHVMQEKYVFDSIWFFNCRECELTKFETSLIRCFQPEYNINCKSIAKQDDIDIVKKITNMLLK